MPGWNTWVVRTALKAISGLLFAVSILPLLYIRFNAGIEYNSIVGFLIFIIALVFWIAFYKLETESRKNRADDGNHKLQENS